MNIKELKMPAILLLFTLAAYAAAGALMGLIQYFIHS